MIKFRVYQFIDIWRLNATFRLLQVVDKNSKPHIQVETAQGEKIFAAEEISAMVLIKMKETAEAYLGKKVTHAVVTVPAVS